MGRAPCCDKTKVKRGPWSPEEDTTLKNYIQRFGTGGNWIALPQKAGLKRCGKSCRLRWLNYLRPDIKHGGFTEEEDNIILTLYNSIGSRWSVIASQLPGRTDNDVKNYWNTKLKKKLFLAAGTTTIDTNKDNSMPSTSAFENQIYTNNYYGNSDLPTMMNPANSQPLMNLNYGQQNSVAQEEVHQVCLPRLTEVPEIPSSYDQEIPSLLPLENKYGFWSTSGGGEYGDGLLMGPVDSGFSYDHLLNGFEF